MTRLVPPLRQRDNSRPIATQGRRVARFFSDDNYRSRSTGDRCSASSRMSGCEARGGAGDRPDVREHAARVPGWEGSHQRRGAVDLDAALAGGLNPGELARVPFDEGFRFRRDVEVLVEARVCLADLGVSTLDE